MPGAFAAILLVALAQTPAETYAWPLDLPRELTSSFGEYRVGRFHMGIDLRTGPIGKDVHAAADGYISRVRCSPYGYGKAVYIQFDDGNSAVYAHLDDFAPALRDYVRAAQHTREAYTVDLTVPRGKFRVKKGELIAKSGQTGIGVPHLHYELRDKDGVPINPRLLGVNWPDKTPPEIRAVALVPRDVLKSGLNGGAGVLVVPAKKIATGQYEVPEVRVQGPYAFAIDTQDPAGGSRLGVYRVVVHDDTTEYFRFEQNRISYDETEDGAFAFYPPLADQGKFLALWQWPGNNSKNYTTGSASIAFGGNDQTRLTIAVEDFHGNVSTVIVPLRIDPALPPSPQWDANGKLVMSPPRANPTGAITFDHTGMALIFTVSFPQNEAETPVLSVNDKGFYQFRRVDRRTFSVGFQAGSDVSDSQLRILHPGVANTPQRFVFLKRGAPAQTLTFDDVILRTLPDSPYGALALRVTRSDPGATQGLSSHGTAYEVFPTYMPVDAPMTLSLPMPAGITEVTRGHVYRRDKDKWTRLDTKRPAGRAEAEIKQLGTYAVLEDTTSPTLELLQPSGAITSARPVIRARAIDLGSGLETFRATYNGKWILLAYDPEQDLLEWEQDEDLPSGPGALAIEIRDYAGNIARRELALTIP